VWCCRSCPPALRARHHQTDLLAAHLVGFGSSLAPSARNQYRPRRLRCRNRRAGPLTWRERRGRACNLQRFRSASGGMNGADSAESWELGGAQATMSRRFGAFRTPNGGSRENLRSIRARAAEKRRVRDREVVRVCARYTFKKSARGARYQLISRPCRPDISTAPSRAAHERALTSKPGSIWSRWAHVAAVTAPPVAPVNTRATVTRATRITDACAASPAVTGYGTKF